MCKRASLIPPFGTRRKIFTVLFVVGIASMGPVRSGYAHDPITPAQIAAYAEGGTYQERLDRINWLAPMKVGRGIASNAVFQMRYQELRASGASDNQIADALYPGGPGFAFPYKANPELPSRGTVKTLTILVDFADMRATDVLPGLTNESIEKNIYGDGTATAKLHQPYESVHAYYHRASQGKVDLQGNVLGWYHFPKKRAAYAPKYTPGMSSQDRALTDNRAILAMMREALGSYDAGHDFSQYDNDSDGDIDLVTMIYAGPNTGWGSFWWAYRWEFFTPEAADIRFDGKRLKQFVFEFANLRDGPEPDFDPLTLMHEMGHAFGLADYYDYQPGVGPDGGVGGLDMMDANTGNQNAFSRWLLDWIKPEVVSSGPPTEHTLVASGSNRDDHKAVAIFPKLHDDDAPTQEMFIVENRSRFGNDGGESNLPNSGLLIWHVVASVNSQNNGFAMDNSYTATKLIRLMRPGTNADFGSTERANAQTFFNTSAVFTPASTPSTSSYSGQPTQVAVTDISAPGEVMAAKIGFVTGAPANQPPPAFSGAPDGGAVDLEELNREHEGMQSAKPSELKEKWEQATASPRYHGRQQELYKRLVLSQWAQKDGLAALNAALGATDKAGDLVPLALEAWANHSPSEAARWYFGGEHAKNPKLAVEKHEARFLKPIFNWLAKNNADTAVASLSNLAIPEIEPAVAGITSAIDPLMSKSAELKAKFETLARNRKAVELVHDFQATHQGRNADPKVKAELKGMLKSLTSE